MRKIIKKFTIWFVTLAYILFSTLIFKVLPALGSTDNIYRPNELLTVTEQVILSDQSSNYLLSGIEVKPGGQLIVEEGVTLKMASNSAINISGIAWFVGSKYYPVIITGQQEQKWEGFTVKSQASLISMQYVDIVNFIHPVRLEINNYYIDNIKLIDGVDNRLMIGSTGMPLSNQTLGDVFFIERGLNGSQPISSLNSIGVTVMADFKAGYTELNYGQFKFKRIKIYDYRNPDILGLAKIHNLELIAPIGQKIGFKSDYNRITYDWNGCSLVSQVIPAIDTSQMAFAYQKYWIGDYSCLDLVDYPTIFVPGYGSSLNLPVLLTSPTKIPFNENGWGFLNSLVPGYVQLNADLAKNNITYQVAYYDWRLNFDDSARLYLKKKIDEVKTFYKVSKVNLVAHSFGGIVSRSYIESDYYEGDVNQLIQIGTPNQGAGKAYGIWQAGVLPTEWSALYHLLKYYKHISFMPWESNLKVVHDFFPSALEIAPIYPALSFEDGQFININQMKYQNSALQELNNNAERMTRVNFSLYYADNLDTQQRFHITEPDFSKKNWPDGEILYGFEQDKQNGDGTVPAISANSLNFNRVVQVEGEHNELPAIVSKSVINQLYPRVNYIKADPEFLKKKKKWYNLLFDCPISVKMTYPDQQTVNSEDYTDMNNNASDEAGWFSEPEGNIMKFEDQMIWFNFEAVTGNYLIEITPKENGKIFFWLDEYEDISLEVTAGEKVYYNMTVNNPDEKPTFQKVNFNLDKVGAQLIGNAIQ